MDNSEKIKKLQDELDELNIDKVRAKRKMIEEELKDLQDEENNKLNEEIKQIFQKYNVNAVHLKVSYYNRYSRDDKPIDPISHIVYRDDKIFIRQEKVYGNPIRRFIELSPECFDGLKDDIIYECEKYRVVLFLKYAFQKNSKEMIDSVIHYFKECNEEYILDERKDDYQYVMSNYDFGENLCDYYANFRKLTITHNPIESEWLFVTSLSGDINYKCYDPLHMMFVSPITFSCKKKSDGDYFVCDCDGLCRMTERIAKAKDDDTPEMRFKNKMLNIIKERKLDI